LVTSDTTTRRALCASFYELACLMDHEPIAFCGLKFKNDADDTGDRNLSLR
jgi:hypothetical protein